MKHFKSVLYLSCLNYSITNAAFQTTPSQLLFPTRGTTTTRTTSLLHQSNSNTNRSKPRTGPAQTLLNTILNSPLWKLLLVPQARANIVQTAEANGIPWKASLQWLRSQPGPWNSPDESKSNQPHAYPSYYTKPFHAYDNGNLDWEAAMEQELAGRAVGARNFPSYGADGEDAFRTAFDVALDSIGASRDVETIVDLGCGTGTSTRRLAKKYPLAQSIVGVDLSPYFIGVGRRLLELAPSRERNEWVTTIVPDARIQYLWGDATRTSLPDQCADVVNVGLVLHELPLHAAKGVCDEAWRLLKADGGQLWITEMDFESPAFRRQRENALLFSLIRSTEPFLDEYADGFGELLREWLLVGKFERVVITAATGRHYALVATKGGGGGGGDGLGVLEDLRFREDGSYAVEDTHLKTWESKKE